MEESNPPSSCAIVASMPGPTLDPRSSLIGAVLGLVIGGIGGFFSASQNVEPPGATPAARTDARPRPTTKTAASGDAAAPMTPPTPGARISFAQQGEDLVVQEMLYTFRVNKPTYLDIGAHEPVHGSNTYLFYATGSHGVLVEPNPTFVEKLKKVRPLDTVLDVGVGIDDQQEADYYVIGGDNGQLNTFSKRQADTLVAVHNRTIERVIKRKLVPINRILEEHFKDAAPDFLSIDVEGLDLAILKTLDWNRWRPKVVCVETSMVENGHVNADILTLMEKNDYELRGGSFVNSVFLDRRFVKKVVDELTAAKTADEAAAADAGR